MVTGEIPSQDWNSMAMPEMAKFLFTTGYLMADDDFSHIMRPGERMKIIWFRRAVLERKNMKTFIWPGSEIRQPCKMD